MAVSLLIYAKLKNEKLTFNTLILCRAQHIYDLDLATMHKALKFMKLEMFDAQKDAKLLVYPLFILNFKTRLQIMRVHMIWLGYIK